ncbi:MAG: class II glutamine amidotransferase [Prevotellaceae bacterium]|jgi:predicted glutamine amidotransferase|nr:class II glutamine amidotransferase [Prevotellaceae bacterium]
MCVIIVKPAGVKMPSKHVLQMAARYNPHGCGFCTKSLMYKSLDFATFMKHLSNVDDSEACLIHFRFATTGSIKASNCHPFKDKDTFFAHNGVLSIETRNDKTDSETFFKEYVMPFIRKYSFDSDEFRTLISAYDSLNRFAIMKAGVIKLFGNFQELEGCYFSNLRFKSAFF